MAGDEDHLPRQKFLRNTVNMTHSWKRKLCSLKTFAWCKNFFTNKQLKEQISGSVLLSSCSSVRSLTPDCSVATRGEGSSWRGLAHFTSRSGGEILAPENSLIWLPKATHQVNVKPHSRTLFLTLFLVVSVRQEDKWIQNVGHSKVERKKEKS